MAEDRTKKDYDNVENLKDIIRAREERVSAFADDVDAMEDVDLDHVPIDPVEELTFPHPGHNAPDGSQAIDTELFANPDDKEVEFDWQDNAEEMLPPDPEANEGMGDDDALHTLGHVDPNELLGPIPSVEYGSETSTAATEEEREEYGLDGGEPEERRNQGSIPLETAMDTDSDEYDFRVQDKVDRPPDRETALEEFAEIEEAIREETGEEGKRWPEGEGS